MLGYLPAIQSQADCPAGTTFQPGGAPPCAPGEPCSQMMWGPYCRPNFPGQFTLPGVVPHASVCANDPTCGEPIDLGGPPTPNLGLYVVIAAVGLLFFLGGTK